MNHAKLKCCDGKQFREIQDNTWDARIRINECNSTGVNIQVLSTVPVMFNYWAKPEQTYDLARYLNDHIAGVVKDYPDRFIDSNITYAGYKACDKRACTVYERA
jgi:predicted TIM-barrel fold metal-dependent hydrolase